MSHDIDHVARKRSTNGLLDRPTSTANPSETPPGIPLWGETPIPNRYLTPGEEERSPGRSGISERGSATTLQTVQDMGHQDWIESLNGRQVSSKPTKVELSSFWVKLLDACVASAIDPTGEPFLPFGRLLELLNLENVKELLRQQFPDRPGEFVYEVYDKKDGHPKRLKVMGTLLLMGYLKFLPGFIEAEIDDSQLPLVLGRQDQRPILSDRSGKKIESGHKLGWGYSEAEFFMTKQMQLCSLFCAVKDDGGYVKHFRLPRGFILPFLNCQPPEEVLHGGFGQITKVRIEPSHLWYQGRHQNPEYFSVKTIRHAPLEHPDEADSLSRRLVIRDRADREHLHRLLFSFRRADFYYFVFEWADGDLTKLWQEMPQLYKPNIHGDVCWFFRQCVGIVRSLHALQNHDPSFSPGEGMEGILFEACHGRHNDIKPENILWFKNYEDTKRDHLVIADLGLTQFNTTKSKSRTPWIDMRGYTQTYKAPESDVTGEVGDKYDIWGLGCVFLLHASVFLLGDAKCTDDFSKKRVKEDRKHSWHESYASDVFYNLVSDGGHVDTGSTNADRVTTQAKLKRTVEDWIKDLQNHKSCSASMIEFLELISEGMLVPDASKRDDAKMILKALERILEGCEMDVTFACSPKNAKLVPGLDNAVGKQHSYEVDATASQSQALAGISGGQANPDASIKLPSGEAQENTTSDEMDLVLTGEPGPSFSTFRCIETPPASLYSETSRTQTSGSSVSSSQHTSSINKLIQSFKLLTISERSKR